jgi:phage FluMu gp28-like protein
LKPLLAGIPSSQHEEVIDKFCLTYPTWFFELLTEVAPETPLVLEQYQIAYLLDDSRFKVTNKTRQAGGSLIVAGSKFIKAYQNEGYNCDVVSINRSEAQGKITYVRNLWDSLPLKWKHPLTIDTYERIAFHGRTRRMSQIRSIAASAGVRGGKKDIVFDEAHHIPNFDPMFIAALPATVRGGGGMDVLSTPLGQQGRYWEIFTNVNNLYPHWSRHEFLWIDVSFFCKDIAAARQEWEEDYASDPYALIGPIYDKYANDDLKMVMDSLTSEEQLQEFCGVFLDESTAYFPYSIIEPNRIHDEKQPNIDDVLEPWTERPEDNQNVVNIGIDFAEGKKGGDSTSIQVVENDGGTWKQRFYSDLSGPEWSDFDRQLDHMSKIIARFRPQRVSCDATGLGTKTSADLKKRHGSLVEPLKFTNQNKEEMAQDVKGLMERRRLWLQYNNKPIRGQIHNIKRTITPDGNIKYSGHPHDDMFWALALAVRGARRQGFRIMTLND